VIRRDDSSTRPEASAERNRAEDPAAGRSSPSAPQVSLPKSGGAIRGLGEKFAINPVNGTAAITVPIATSPSRSRLTPELSLTYDSGAGNGPFGFGWHLTLPSITRKTEKGIPRYRDGENSDVFILSGAEDLVPQLRAGSAPEEGGRDAGGAFLIDETVRDGFHVRRYRPRIEGLFARIERWSSLGDPGDVFWRSMSRDNVTTFYGKTAESRIADPSDASRIFSWLICESYDDKGNASLYSYKAEDDVGVDRSRANERNRTAVVNRYLKRIYYGNTRSHLDPAFASRATWKAATKWLFEVVFDYGEHDEKDPEPDDRGDWIWRNDPFSVYRSGFEVRTQRLCQRVLMFHHFPDEPIGANCLVRSTDFVYRESRGDPADHKRGNPIASFIASISHSGYKRRTSGGYLKRSLPPLIFAYSEAAVRDEVHDVDPGSLENLPTGLDRGAYQWIDLDGEGVPGILTEQAEAWFYKRNLSPLSVTNDAGGVANAAMFAPLELVAEKPAASPLGASGWQFQDLAGDGRLDLARFEGPVAGFFEKNDSGDWKNFVAFRVLPNIDWSDPQLRFVDLTGDGLADVLITENSAFLWYLSLGEEGFAPSERVLKALDEEEGPRLVFANGEQSIYLADMSGDGLSDLVRIRNGEVCYWPNLGYGRFGPKVAMDNAPWFDPPDEFSQNRVRLADIDGSGVTDIIYLGGDGARLYFNESGNGWTAGRRLQTMPRVDDVAAVHVVDLFANGTACLVWSSPLPDQTRARMRYIDLMGGQKPYLLVATDNGLGAETRIEYAASTKFYLADKAAGRPWVPPLPFPVHVVERVETLDRIGRNRFVSRYAYHQGYFDGEEREFRGFGMVEQFDTEEFATLIQSDTLPDAANLDDTSHVPPMLTKTWFHTGVFFDRERVSTGYAAEYFREPGSTVAEASALLLPNTVLPDGFSAEEQREACRALKGSLLRQEVYALDGTPSAAFPVAVSEHNYAVRRLQPRVDDRYAVLLVHPGETIDCHYERNPEDPRVAHALTLEADAFGNVLKSAAVAYGRRHPDAKLAVSDQVTQGQVLITYTENDFTNAVASPDSDRAPLPCATRTYELTGYVATGSAGRFQASDFVRDADGALAQIYDSELAYDAALGSGRQRRLIEHRRIRYRADDLSGLLADGSLEALALPGESYSLALTPALLANVFQRKTPGQPVEILIPNPAAVLPTDVAAGQVAERGGYVDLDGDGCWWVPSGRTFYSPDVNDAAATERDYAQQHFFAPLRQRDAFGNTASAINDAYDLLVLETRDPAGNTTTAGERDGSGALVSRSNDYRVLKPRLVMDANRNRAAAAFDALGMVVGTAVMGKPEETLGDTLAGFDEDLTEPTSLDQIARPLADPHAVLQRASSRVIYDPFAYARTRADAQPMPAVVYSLLRETHESDLAPGQQTRVQHAFSYSDGLGREIQKKVLAEPGSTSVGPADPRWAVSGWTIVNNKGQPVRKYEPFFADTHLFEFAPKAGVSPVLFYDPSGRVVAKINPNGTFEAVRFDAWQQTTRDANDTVLSDPSTDADTEGYTEAYFAALRAQSGGWQTWYQRRAGGALGPVERAAADKAAAHANTPTTAFADSLGRLFLTVADNGLAAGQPQLFKTRVKFDIEGNAREVIDALGRSVMRYDYDMLGNRIHESSMDAGERWMLDDVTGKPIRSWDSRDHEFRTAYDALRRPIESRLVEAAASPLVVARTVYGESQSAPEANNLRGQIVAVFDQAGVVTHDAFDFKGNLRRSHREHAVEYRRTIDWSASVTLQSLSYVSSTAYDALNRPIQVIPAHADGSGARLNVLQPRYDRSGLFTAVDVWLGLTAEPTGLMDPATSGAVGVSRTDYDAKGQRLSIVYKNGAATHYTYDPLTFRLTDLYTRRGASFTSDCANPQPPPATIAAAPYPAPPGVSCGLQNLNYTYDPAGNITHIVDAAQQPIYFRNRRVEPSADYRYDAIYRLVEASGREHLGQTAGAANAPTAPSALAEFHARQAQPGDGNAVGTYVERYAYDAVGNILSLRHLGSDPASAGWQRCYQYALDSNRLLSTTNPNVAHDPNQPCPNSYAANRTYAETYGYDAHGNMIVMPHLTVMQWDFHDELLATSRQAVTTGVPETTWYVYDANGERARKLTDRQATLGAQPLRKCERLYLGGVEIYREFNTDGATVLLERETLHIMDGERRIALVEARTQGNDGSPAQAIRYQVGNHLGSAVLELDETAQIVSYEEYFPYGSTSYQAVRSQTETPKRYRYTGKERDEESGLYYHGARYYAPWLGRWISCDPAGLVDGLNLYQYVESKVINYIDKNGKEKRVADYRTFINPFVDDDHINENDYRKWEENEIAAARSELMKSRLFRDLDKSPKIISLSQREEYSKDVKGIEDEIKVKAGKEVAEAEKTFSQKFSKLVFRERDREQIRETSRERTLDQLSVRLGSLYTKRVYPEGIRLLTFEEWAGDSARGHAEGGNKIYLYGREKDANLVHDLAHESSHLFDPGDPNEDPILNAGPNVGFAHKRDEIFAELFAQLILCEVSDKKTCGVKELNYGKEKKDVSQYAQSRINQIYRSNKTSQQKANDINNLVKRHIVEH
jgi:RHS repeat-associated protein